MQWNSVATKSVSALIWLAKTALSAYIQTWCAINSECVTDGERKTIPVQDNQSKDLSLNVKAANVCFLIAEIYC
jgi:hypothetical protein